MPYCPRCKRDYMTRYDSGRKRLCTSCQDHIIDNIIKSNSDIMIEEVDKSNLETTLKIQYKMFSIGHAKMFLERKFKPAKITITKKILGFITIRKKIDDPRSYENVGISSKDVEFTIVSNTVRMEVIVSLKNHVAGWHTGGLMDIGDNFEAGYTVKIRFEHDEEIIKKVIIGALRNMGFGILPSHNTLLCHKDDKSPVVAGAEKIMIQLKSQIINTTNGALNEDMPEQFEMQSQKESIIEQAEKLLDLGVGDTGRMDHICKTLQANKKLYRSDQNYLEESIKRNLYHK